MQAQLSEIPTAAEFALSDFGGIEEMQKYLCEVCDYVYDPAVGDPKNGVQPGTPFEEIPDDWVCPLCGVGKDGFSPE